MGNGPLLYLQKTVGWGTKSLFIKRISRDLLPLRGTGVPPAFRSGDFVDGEKTLFIEMH